MVEVGSIEAILTLNASDFNTKLENSQRLVSEFGSVVKSTSSSAGGFSASLRGLLDAIDNVNSSLDRFTGLSKESESFNKFANGVKALSSAVETLGAESTNASVGMERLKEIVLSMTESIGTPTVKIDGLAKAMRNLSNAESQGIKVTEEYKLSATNVQQAVTSMTIGLGEGSKNLALYHQNLKALALGVEEFNSIETKLATTTRTTIEAQREAIATLNANRESVMNLITGKRQLSAEEEKDTSVTRQNTSAHQQNANAMSQSSARTNQLTTATSRLGKAMSSLRMIGTLVGSMLAYNFAHKLLVATGETIHAKSEMEGYFKMLHFGQSDINEFNSALDRTVQQFQRVNKYSLGETIASIGVEFNLTTQEMEKAMKVTSMITSEYLRAGRNANEASLAVKDVLQGQFQRLSRETGVKGEQLKEAGWSGDTNDVLGLMEALEKVAESRNWDVFAEKANSLNDIITILQNRFGEWSADMVYAVQPAIISSFNAIMNVASMLGSALSGVWEWLNGDGIESQIVKWTLFGTAITTVVGAFISYRTGAGLLQIAQMGLNGTIASTVLGLEAETVATYGTRTAILSKIMGVEAEEVAELSVKDAILSKVLGLDAEILAETNLKEAILTTSLTRELEIMKLEGATEKEMANTIALYENNLAHESNIKLLLAQIMHLDMTTYAEQGFMVALLESTTAIESETIALMGLETQLGLLAVSVGLPLVVIGAFAVALGGLALKTMDATEKMSKFYDIQKNGEQYINDARSSVTLLESKIKSLTETQQKYTQGSKEYENVGKAIDSLNDKLDLANQNVNANYEAYQRVISAQEHYDTGKLEAQLDLQLKINQALIDTGLSIEEANELSNNYLSDAIDGADQLYSALQSVVHQYELEAQGVSSLTAYWTERGLSGEEISVKVKPYIDTHEDLNSHIEKMKLSSDVLEVTTEWLNVQYNQIKLSFTENLPKIEDGDVAGGVTGLLKGLAHGLADLPIFSDFWNWVFEKTGVMAFKGTGWKGLFPALGTGLMNAIHGIDHFLDELIAKPIMDWFGSLDLGSWLTNIDLIGKIFDAILPQGVSASDGSSDHPSIMEDLSDIFGFNIQSWIDNFTSDPLGTLGIDLSGFDIFGTLLNFLLPDSSSDQPSFMEDLSAIFGFNIQSWIGSFMADPIGTLGIDLSGFDIFGTLLKFLPSDGGVGIWEWVNTTIIQPMSQSLWSGITSIPLVSDILALFGLVNGENSGSSQKGRDIGDAFKTAVEDKIRNIPILGDVLQFLGVIPQANGDANQKGYGVGDNIKQGEAKGHEGIARNVSTEMSNVITAISNKFGEAYSTAHEIGSQILNGIKNALDMHSPSIISRELIANEFGVYIPNAIRDAGDVAYSTAYDYASQIKQGIQDNGTTTVGLDGMVQDYESDAQTIATSSEMMGLSTTTAFDDMALAVNNTTGQMQSNVVSTYSAMGTKQNTMLTDMKNKNTSAYNDMYTKSNQSLIQMRDSTSNVTHQMTQAWSHMKDQIVESANRLKNDSTVHFNQLSNTIGAFYRKIQNPSSWGSAGSPSLRSNRPPNRRVGRALASGFGGNWTGSSSMTIGALKKKICPNGDCGSLFDGFNASDIVDVATFFSMLGGNHGFGGWSSWNGTHYNYIKSTSDGWGMKSPTINLVGGIPTNANYKVGDFENGQPRISFGSFQSMAESIFSAIPYKFYYDSSWKGSWLGALQAGACNCVDGANALVAFASSCGFSGTTAHGTWVDPDGTTYPHVYAIINGKKMDTTGWQQRKSWSAGSPNVRAGTTARPPVNNNNTPPVNIEINIDTVYGVDDLNSKIEEGIDKGLQKHFNKNYAVGI